MTSDVNRILAEGPIGFHQAARQFCGYRNNATLHPATVYRWAIQGVVLPNGERVFLEAIRIGGRYLTSQPAIARFVEAQTAARLGEPVLPNAQRTPAEAAAAAHDAGEQLAERSKRRRNRLAKSSM
jgi:hypothetical protein